MKKSLLLAASLLCAIAIYAQEYKLEGSDVIFTKVIDNTGKTVEEAHASLEAFFAMRYNDVNATQKLNQTDHLIYKGLFSNVSSEAMGMWVYDVPHSLEVSIKDNRIRLRVIIDEIIYRGTSSTNRHTLRMIDFLPTEKKQRKIVVETYNNTCARIEALFHDIENSLNKVKVEEDW